MARLERYNSGGFGRRSSEQPDRDMAISFSSDNLSNNYLRGRDLGNVKEFNDKVREWSVKVKADLVSEIKALITTDKELSKSLRNKLYHGNKRVVGDDYEVDRIGFSFRAEGVYVHVGTGRGYKRSGGVTSRNSISKLRGNSAGKPRYEKPWFNPIVKKHIDELQDIVFLYSEELVINSTRIFIQS